MVLLHSSADRPVTSSLRSAGKLSFEESMSPSSPLTPPYLSRRGERQSSPESRRGGLFISNGARRIVQEALRDDVSVAELAQMAEADPAFAVRVLSVANSAAYGRQREVTNVNQACALLGIRGMRNIALGMLVADLVPAAEGAASLLSSCLRRAVISRALARSCARVQHEDAFFAGLLLELGLLHQACDAFDECLEVSQSPGRHRVTRERALGLTPHPKLGAALAVELGLPDAMIEAIAEHHASVLPKAPLAAVCWVAEVCAAVLETGDGSQNLTFAETAASHIGVAAEELHDLLQGASVEVQELSHALDSPAGIPQSERFLHRPVERDLQEMHEQYEQMVAALSRAMDERDRLAEELDAAHRLLAEVGLRASR